MSESPDTKCNSGTNDKSASLRSLEFEDVLKALLLTKPIPTSEVKKSSKAKPKDKTTNQ